MDPRPETSISSRPRIRLQVRRCTWSFERVTSFLLRHGRAGVWFLFVCDLTTGTGMRVSTSTSSGGSHGTSLLWYPGCSVFLLEEWMIQQETINFIGYVRPRQDRSLNQLLAGWQADRTMGVHRTRRALDRHGNPSGGAHEARIARYKRRQARSGVNRPTAGRGIQPAQPAQDASTPSGQRTR